HRLCSVRGGGAAGRGGGAFKWTCKEVVMGSERRCRPPVPTVGFVAVAPLQSPSRGRYAAPMPNVLVVDDDDVIRDVVVRYLERDGFTTEQMADGASARGAIERRPPDLVVL